MTMDPSAQVASLISQLKDPRYASSATAISQQIQEFQLQPSGWQVADGLLNADDPDLNFYGALTFQIKLNKDGKTLSEADAESVLGKLLGHFATCVREKRPSRVLEKLSSALATFVSQSIFVWDNALDGIIAAILSGNISTIVKLPDDSADRERIIGILDDTQLLIILRFAKVMAEDLNRLDAQTLEGSKVEASFGTSFDAFLTMTEIVVRQRQGRNFALVEELLGAFSAWAMYALQHFQPFYDVWAKARRTTDVVIQLLHSNDFGVILATADTLSELVKEYTVFITKEQLAQVWPALQHIQSTTADQSPEERMPVLKLASAWGIASMSEIFDDLGKQEHRQLVDQMIRGFFDTDWAEDGTDQLWILLDFWNGFGEALVDKVDYESDKDEAWEQQICSIVESLMQALFDALVPRSDEVLAETDPDNVEDYKRLRAAFSDLGTLFISTGFIPVYGIIADQLDHALEPFDTHRIESILQVLADMWREYEATSANEQGLTRIFKSSLIRDLTDAAKTEGMSVRTKRWLINFIDGYSFFLKQDDSLIPVVITFIMTTLEQSTLRSPKLADLSARCMASICTACRDKLAQQIDGLMSFCGRVLGDERLSAYQREKIYGSVTSVIAALPSDEAIVTPVHSVVMKIHADMESGRQSLQARTPDAVEVGEAKLVMALQCLAAVAKALQTRPQPINLDEDDTTGNGKHDVWSTEEGKAVTSLILQCLQYINIIPQNGDALEAICAILRVGLIDTVPGPFSIPSDLTLSILTSMTPDHPRLESLITTSCAFLSAHSRRDVPRSPQLITPLTSSITTILLSLGSPLSDPTVAQMSLDYLDRTISHYPDVLLSLQPPTTLPTTLRLALQCLTSTAPMLKRATASFVSAFMLLPSSLRRGDGPQPPIPGLAEYSAEVVASYLPDVAAAVAHQVGGHAQRSELDAIAKVLRSLVLAAGTGARVLLEQALVGEGWPVEARVGESEKRVFVGKIIMLRGGRGTVEAVREFWARARGTVSSFT